MPNLKEMTHREIGLTGGHRACTGCGFPIVIKLIMTASKDPVVTACATGCMEVTTTIYPYTAWTGPFIHNAFENSAATISGVEAAYKALSRKGKIDKKIKFVAFGGDGGTYDIGLQSLSGAMERGHNILYVCYDNEAYMNTGIQRSSATPRGTNTTTSPSGTVSSGKGQYPKDLTAIMAAHNIPYVAQASISNWADLSKKAEKALEVEGPAFLNVLSPCQLGWGFAPNLTVDIAERAVNSCMWPLYEVENGVWKVNYKPKNKIPVSEYMKDQARFKHLLRPENAGLLAEIQADVDRKWELLLSRAEEEARAKTA